MRAVEAARNVYLAVPISTLNVLLGSGHVGQLRPGLRRWTPTPEVVVVTATGITTAIHVDIRSIGASTRTIASRRPRRGRGPGTGDAAADRRAGWCSRRCASCRCRCSCCCRRRSECGSCRRCCRRRECGRRRWCCRRRAAWSAAVAATLHLSQELEGLSHYASYTPDLSRSVEPSLVSLTIGKYQVRR